MKKINLKAIAYSVVCSAILSAVTTFLYSKTVSFLNIGVTGAMLLIAFLIIFWKNEALLEYFWKSPSTDWRKKSDLWISAILGAIIYLSARYSLYTLPDDISGFLLALIVCLSSAIGLRKAYLRNAPADLEKYEQQIKKMEAADTFVTVAECKDNKSVQIIKNLLESNGIEVLVYGENAPQYMGAIPVRIPVRKIDQEKAEKLINA